MKKAVNTVLIILLGAVLLLVSQSNSKAAEKPKPGGTFVVGMAAEPRTLNPAITSEFEARTVGANILSKLVYADVEENYHGDLAEKWTVSKDNLRIRFDLRKGAKWHDGRPVTAEDVKFSLETLEKYHPRGVELKRISEILILSDTSLEIRFRSPSVTFFPFLDEAGFIIPKHVYGTGEDPSRHPSNNSPVGSGPFIFGEWKRADRITLVKNTNYYIHGEPFVDKTIFRIIPSGPSRVLALETGEIDYLAERALPESDVVRLKENPNFVVTDRGLGIRGLTTIVFNTRRKPWNDLRVRQAVAYAIDRKVMVEKAAFGLALPAYSPFSKINSPWAYNPSVEGMYPQDLAKTIKLLDEAGFPVGSDGERFTSTIIFDRGIPRTGDIAEIFRQQLKKVNINIVAQPLDKATADQRTWINRDFDLWVGLTMFGSDPAIGVERFFITEFAKMVPRPLLPMLMSIATQR